MHPVHVVEYTTALSIFLVLDLFKSMAFRRCHAVCLELDELYASVVQTMFFFRDKLFMF